MDMDGVLVREEHAIPGATEFIARLRETDTPFLLLTNNSIYTPRDLAARLRAGGLDVPEDSIWTSALATARFLEDQRPGGSAFVIGESGLTTALHSADYTINERDPDYVVLGETRTYSFERIAHAIRLISRGARFIATNPDPTGPEPDGPLPATGSVAALISRATGRDPYFAGKPNPLMMRTALNTLEAHSEETAMIGDRMDTDIVGGLAALYVAVRLWMAPDRFAWTLGAVVSACMFVGFILSRTTGLPGFKEPEWELSGIVSLILEAGFLAAFIAARRAQPAAAL